MKGFLIVFVLSGISLSSSRVFAISDQGIPENPLTEARSKLAFTCVHEVKPEPSAESDVLFEYARWLQKNNQLKEASIVDAEIDRLYRIATEHNHYKANINLQSGAMRGHFKLGSEEHLRLTQYLMDAGVATGYYFVGIFLRNGSAGLQKNEEMSLRYFRKAADTGSHQAQYYIGDKLEPKFVAPNIALQMYSCAADQGNAKAAIALGVYLKNRKEYRRALEAFQLGVAAGGESAGGRLEEAFRNPPTSDEVHYLGLAEDLERADRYKKIWRILANYSYANPKVPEINEIVPLPPAPLPEWNGKLQWLEARRANIPPEKPSEVLIHKLAREKGLDPATGKPLSGP